MSDRKSLAHDLRKIIAEWEVGQKRNVGTHAKGRASMTSEHELVEVMRALGDVSYQLGIVAGTLDSLGCKSGLRNVLAAHGQIAKARAALSPSSPPSPNHDGADGKALQSFLSKPFDGGSDNHGS